MAPVGIDQALDRISVSLDRIEGKVDDVDARVRQLELTQARQDGAVGAATTGGRVLWSMGVALVSAALGAAAWAVPKLMERAAPPPLVQQQPPQGPAH